MTYKEKLPAITTFIFDVDGVFTDGNVYLLQDELVRVLNSRDGYALQYASKKGYKIYAITGGSSQEVKKRLLNLGMDEVFLNSSDKLEVYEKLKNKEGFKDEEVVYMGDDIPDYDLILKAGVGCTPKDAAEEVRAIADYVSPCVGGRHCVRDIIEQTLRVQGKWFDDDARVW